MKDLLQRQSSRQKEAIRNRYNAISEGEKSCCGNGSTSCNEGYRAVEGHVAEADLGLGCGLPTESADISEGDTVLDLGSGAGNDVFIARRNVGRSGRVIGIDFASKMIEKARFNAEKLGYANVDFIPGDIDDLPLGDDTIDVVISNCVLNLVPEKYRVFQEIHRVLRTGGHFCISDIVTEGHLPQAVRSAAEKSAGCAAGAIEISQYLGLIKQAGFEEIQVIKQRSVMPNLDALERISPEAADHVTGSMSGDLLSVTVKGKKR